MSKFIDNSLAGRIARARASKRRACAVLAESNARVAKDKQERNLELGITWRGERIPASFFYPWMRRKWGDKNS
jgi:hypothetical protein